MKRCDCKFIYACHCHTQPNHFYHIIHFQTKTHHKIMISIAYKNVESDKSTLIFSVKTPFLHRIMVCFLHLVFKLFSVFLFPLHTFVLSLSLPRSLAVFLTCILYAVGAQIIQKILSHSMYARLHQRNRKQRLG